ncbi:MAG: hypothetical protein CVT81_09665 [Alphaproteobacteria bacterium HGW-Alphaproteobacteria-3]|nr:MAG: hypothetical protein CVT81_09665 [Alphaproteobacteria bacterium HGW-Alphaproteobacteria-3]
MIQRDIHRRFLANARLIVGSRVGFGVLNLVTNVIILHSFGAADLGMVMLLVAYVRVFSDVVKFESWQAVLRYGAIPAEDGDNERLRRLIGVTLTLDLLTVSGAICVAVLLVPYAAGWFGWNAEIAAIAPWFMIVILFVTNATPNGVLRLFDRVEILALQHGVNAVIRLSLVVLVTVFGDSVRDLALAWFAAFVLSAAIPMVVSARELTRRGLLPILTLRPVQAGLLFPGIWRFFLMSNLISTTPIAVTHLTTLVVGATFGGAQAAALQLARQLTSGASAPIKLLGPLLLPDYARLSGRGEWSMLRDVLVQQLRVTVVAVALVGGVLFAVLPLVVELAFGADMLAHIWLFRLLLLATLIQTVGFSLNHAMYSASKGGTALLIQLGAVIVYAAILAGSIGPLGLNAVGVATVAFALVLRGVTLVIGHRLLKKRIGKAGLREG